MSGTGVLTDIRTHARGSRRRTLMVDGEEWGTIPVEVLRDLDVRPGDPLDLADLSARIAASAPVRARERALRLLMYRERSASELETRLVDDGYDAHVAHELVRGLAVTGLVDDGRFAENYARVLVLSRGYGRSRAMRELLAKGLPHELAAATLEAYAPEDAEIDRAIDRAHALARAGDTPDRLAARLVRRGFAPGIAFRAARTELAGLDAPIDPEGPF